MSKPNPDQIPRIAAEYEAYRQRSATTPTELFKLAGYLGVVLRELAAERMEPRLGL